MFFAWSFRLSVCPSVRCPWATISRDAISVYLLEGFHLNLPQIFIAWLETAEVFQSQRSKVKVVCVQIHKCYNGGGIHFCGVASRLRRSLILKHINMNLQREIIVYCLQQLSLKVVTQNGQKRRKLHSFDVTQNCT